MGTKYTKKIPIGKTYGRWTVNGNPYTDKKGRAKVPVICECGGEYKIHAHNLESGKSTQCRECSRGKSPTYSSVARRAYLSSNRVSSSPTSLTAENVSHSFSLQSGTCAITGQQLTLDSADAVMWDSKEGLTETNVFYVDSHVKEQLNGMDLQTFSNLANEWQSHSPIKPKTSDPIEDFFNRRENDE